MKDKSEFVRGWLKKAESDLIAMKASAGAGAADAACFHAQQAAEKYLKAFLADRECGIPPTHNLFKLLDLCATVDSSFSELEDIAELLTPFAVEVRYDMDFWPAEDTVVQAQEAAERIKELVSNRLGEVNSTEANSAGALVEQTGAPAEFDTRDLEAVSPREQEITDQIPALSSGRPKVPTQYVETSPAEDEPVTGNVLRFHLKAWNDARQSFDWRVDLRKFRPKEPLPGFFDREITPGNLREFEDLFRLSISIPGQSARAAEVVFWKSYRQYLNRTRMTEDILIWLESERSWQRFCDALRHLQKDPNWKNFDVLRKSCGQTSAFAVPLTFLVFSDSTRFPLADRHIADWWSENQPGKSQFEREAESGRIKPGAGSWTAYLAWVDFCRNHASRLSEVTGEPWRARDVEMAVWMAQRKKLDLRS